MRMAEKDNVSIATVQMKPDYAPSEVYSTTSEPPPAYKRQSNSVKIAKIAAYTIIASSVIIGVFVLASAYLQARVSCDQVQALDSVLEKELVLETLQQVNREIPRAEALIGNKDEDLQNIEKAEEKSNMLPVDSARKESSVPSSDSSYSESESDESNDLKTMHKKVPVDLDLSELASTLLQNNQKSKMNCVVERKRIIEDVDRPARTVALPFGVNLQVEPKKAQITGERISIFCDGDDKEESKNKKESDDDDSTEDDAEQIRPMFIPIQRLPIPFGAIPQQNPLTHMPQRLLPPQQQFRPMPYQFRPPVPPQFMQPPQQSEPERPQTAHLRIQVQQLPIREFHMPQDIPVQISSNAGNGRSEMPHPPMPHFQVQRIPLEVALKNAGITSEDLRNIQRMAEERITEELRQFAHDENNSEESEESDENDAPSPKVTFPQTQSLPLLPIDLQPPVPKDTMTPPNPENTPIVPIGRAGFGRSLQHPVNLPIEIVHSTNQPQQQAAAEEQKPHILQPRSVE